MASSISGLKAGDPIHVAYGTRVELPNCSKKQVIAKIIQANLTTNEPMMAQISEYKIESITPKSLKEKIYLHYQYAKENPNDYKSLLKCVVACALSFSLFLASVAFVRYLFPKAIENILNGRMAVVMQQFRSHIVESFVLGSLPAGFLTVGIVKLYEIFSHLLQIGTSLAKFGKDPCELNCYLEQVNTSFPKDEKFSTLGNDSDDTFVRDPITLNDIKKEWANAPRFIKVGIYLFSLDSLLKQLFFKPLTNNQVSHPCENRPLTADEQEKLTADLSKLFNIPPNEMLSYWNPYYVSSIFTEDFMLDFDLLILVPEWTALAAHQKAAIRNQLRGDIYANQRFIKFLYDLSSEVIKTKIYNNDQEFFTFENMLSEEQGREFQYHIIP